MDYEKKYKEALELARDYYKANLKLDKVDEDLILEDIFPELKESEDERIRKAIVATIHLYYGEPLEDEAKEMIAWLEKQKTSEEALQYLRENHSSSEMSDFQAAMNIAVAKAYDKGYNDGLEKQGETYTKKDIDNAYIEGMAFAKDELEKQGKQKGYTFKSIPRLLDMIEPSDKAKAYCQKLIDTLVKEGYNTDAKIVEEVLKGWNGEDVPMAIMDEQKPVFEMKTPEESLGIDSDTYNKIVDECIYGEQNPADKLEPKFHKGEWIVWKDKCYKVNYNGCGYELVDQDGLSTSLEYGTIDENAHIWNVTTDAKDGDILHSPNHRLIWIYKDIQYYHVCVNMNYVKENFSTDGFIVIPTDVCPATKDEQTILSVRIKESGYEWDAEKKELKKINSYCQENCKGFQEIGKCFADGECKAKREAKQEPTDEEMKTLLRTEYEKGRADAIVEMQNPSWSEEDEEFLRRAINVTKDAYPMTAKWLKFLKDRVQPKQEWSKKDNQYLCGLIGLIEQSKAELPITLKGKAADNCIDWLKSLKKRYTWKPSDEQLEALKNAIQIKPFENPSDSILWGLYEQLKKL